MKLKGSSEKRWSLSERVTSDYFPIMLTMAMINTITTRPAAETAAAVKAPEIAAATVSEARMSMMTSMRTMPSGVLITSMIPLVALPGFKLSNLLVTHIRKLILQATYNIFHNASLEGVKIG
jgi:hypothetical protein